MSVDGTLGRFALFLLTFLSASLATEVNSQEVSHERNLQEKTTISASPKRFSDLSRQEMLTSRANVANDPSCHWLNQRMNKLEETLMGAMDGMDMRSGYHKKELTVRKKEWVCLKCGVEGPTVHDYAKCQFKR
ncbi:hypothetical protein SOPP22_06345 [Shewanella sp. OPT22]|nr:hypothetical protein SOPP22_06345 [Shewanella sp. OPT22]